VESYAGRSKSPATIKAYASGWRDFLGFCEARGLSALPASGEERTTVSPEGKSYALEVQVRRDGKDQPITIVLTPTNGEEPA